MWVGQKAAWTVERKVEMWAGWWGRWTAVQKAGESVEKLEFQLVGWKVEK